MRTPSRAILRLALAGCLGLVGLSQLPARAFAQAPTPPENVLPDSTFAFLKVENAHGLRQAFAQSQFGQLWADPAMGAWRTDLVEKIEEAGKPLTGGGWSVSGTGTQVNITAPGKSSQSCKA